MIMLLNLLSPFKKNELRKKIIIDLVALVIMVLLIVTIIISIGFLMVKIILQNQFNASVAQTSLVTNSFAEINQDIRRINTDVGILNMGVQDRIPWSDLLITIAEATPKDITFHSMNLDKDEGIIKITGFAATRDNLLLFIKNLQSLQTLENVDSPLSNIFSRNNITFLITAKFKSAELKKLQN